MGGRFFICVVDQPTAVLCPLLELAQPKDRVVFLQKSSTNGNGSKSRLQKAFHSFGFPRGNMKTVCVRDWEDGPHLQEVVRREILCAGSNVSEVYVLVGEGSSVILPLILAESCDKLYLVRNDPRKVAFIVWDKTGGFARRTHGYRKAKAALETLIGLNGYELFTEGTPQTRKIWPVPDGSARSPRPRYGYDIRYTAGRHDNPAALRTPPKTNLSQWKKTWTQFLISRRETDQLYSNLYYATRNAAHSAEELCPPEQGVQRLKRESSSLLEIGATHDTRAAFAAVVKLLCRNGPVTSSLGQELEEAVACRLVDWLEDGGARYAHMIESVWKNVRVCEATDTGTVVAEGDVVLGLRNGHFLCLECKCGSVGNASTWLARREILRRINGGGRLIACTPLYTEFARRSWFADQLKNLQYLRKTVKIEAIPFTLPNQPREFCVCQDEENGDDIWQEGHFEDHLERILRDLEPDDRVSAEQGDVSRAREAVPGTEEDAHRLIAFIPERPPAPNREAMPGTEEDADVLSELMGADPVHPREIVVATEKKARPWWASLLSCVMQLLLVGVLILGLGFLLVFAKGC
ncbi:hypothetical protein HRbin36_00528 [bacterium HR36]|nr:hypothetical protein HRbin36_00528 [bacterium HR36]